MSKEVLKKLLEDYVMGTISPDEKRYLLTLLTDPAFSEEAKDLLLQDLEEGRYDSDYIPEVHDLLHEQLSVLMNAASPRPVHRIRFLKTTWLKYAAAVLIVVAGVIAYYTTPGKKVAQTVAKSNKPSKPDVAPGGEKAVLTLADGSSIILDDAANGDVAQQGNTQVVKMANGQIAYNVEGVTGKDIMWNTMTTPAGGQYQVTLPDGTGVWLNAASSITFPTAFVSNKRRVKITGEVYFEVVKMKEKPFVVDINGRSSVEVLGTSFNINSYHNEAGIKTTLIKGSVKVMKEEQHAVLTPGQQATIITAPLPGATPRNAGSITVRSGADLEQALAWKNGLFSFNDADLPAVMRQLERWYDIKVHYAGKTSDITLKGKMYRNVNLSVVLNFLERMGVKFRIEGKTVTVL